MEREFLLGVDFNLYVDKPTYEAWLNLLKGLVCAKERDWRRVANSVGQRGHQQQHVRGRGPVTTQLRRKSYTTTTGSPGPLSSVFATPSAAATTAPAKKKTRYTSNPYPHTYRPPSPRGRGRSSPPTTKSSVQGQTSYSSRKNYYWAPDPQQQTYVYAPNNAAVGYIDNVCIKFKCCMDVDAYTRAT